MDDPGLLRLVGQIAGIGGLALGVFLLLFREVIRKRIFPTISQDHAYRILRLFLVLTFLIAASGIAAWVLAGAGRVGSSDSRLSLVDIGLAANPDEHSGFPALDIKVRNTGDTAAFLKEAHINTLDKHIFRDCRHYDAEPANWTYQINLDNHSSIALSQQVRARGVDRFLLVVGHSLTGASTHAFYRMRLVLMYDEDNKQLVSKEFTLMLDGVAERMAYTTLDSDESCFDALRKELEPVRLWPLAYSLPDYFKDDRK